MRFREPLGEIVATLATASMDRLRRDLAAATASSFSSRTTDTAYTSLELALPSARTCVRLSLGQSECIAREGSKVVQDVVDLLDATEAAWWQGRAGTVVMGPPVDVTGVWPLDPDVASGDYTDYDAMGGWRGVRPGLYRVDATTFVALRVSFGVTVTRLSARVVADNEPTLATKLRNSAPRVEPFRLEGDTFRSFVKRDLVVLTRPGSPAGPIEETYWVDVAPDLDLRGEPPIVLP